MIIKLAYWENTTPKMYNKGPYVLVQNPLDGSLFRIEKMEPKGGCPCAVVNLPDEKYYGFHPFEELEPIVEELNKKNCV